MTKSAMQQLAEYGQSVWLDYIDRPLLETGKLKKMIRNGLRGMTSNPSIFNNAIGHSNDYDEEIVSLKNKGKTTFEIYDELSIRDIQSAADQFKEVFTSTARLDGYVSLEINPFLANKVKEQIDEGLRLFKKVGRENVMIKVPSTEEGFTVIEELIASGVNVNVTLIFSLAQYEKTVTAYFQGLKRLADSGGDLSNVRSVASVFVSRIDTAVDKSLDELLSKVPGKKKILNGLKGKAAVANSRIIYEKGEELFAGREFKNLEAKGANVQRVLWGSTGAKNPAYSDIKYVTELIAKPTVNTLPEKTINAFLDHGEVKFAFDYDFAESQRVIIDLKDNGIDVNKVCMELLEAGCVSFNEAFEALLESIEKKAATLSVK